MTCEGDIDQNGFGGGVAVAERADVSTYIPDIKYPKPYFDPAIDWQAGAENPIRTIIEERSRAKLIQEREVMVVRNMYFLMSHIAHFNPEGIESIVFRARTGIFHTGGQLEPFDPEKMLTEKSAVSHAYTLRHRLFSMIEQRGTDLPDKAVTIASTISSILTEKFKLEVTANGGVQKIKKEG